MAELADAADSKSYTCRQESADQHEGREPLQGQGNRRGRGNEGAIGWNSGAGSARSESRNSAHFPKSGSEVEVWTNRDTSSGGFERNDEGERAATAKGHLAIRPATRERMTSIMAKGLAWWQSCFSAGLVRLPLARWAVDERSVQQLLSSSSFDLGKRIASAAPTFGISH